MTVHEHSYRAVAQYLVTVPSQQAVQQYIQPQQPQHTVHTEAAALGNLQYTGGSAGNVN